MTLQSAAALLLGAAAACTPARSFDGTDVLTGQAVALRPRPTLQPDFSGSYLSPQLGLLRLVQAGETLRGHYARRSCGCNVSGWVEGTVDANLAELRWIEEVTGCGSRRRRRGAGYLFHQPAPDAHRPGQLFGERSTEVRLPATRFRTAHVVERTRETWSGVGLTAAERAGLEPANACP